METNQVLQRIEDAGVIPAIRVRSAADALFAARAVRSSGIAIAEITMTIPGALDVLTTLSREIPEMILGAGSIWTVDAARRCLDAGAHFLTTAGLVRDLVEFAVREKIPVLPGALTPTEVADARLAGAHFVKIFPCSQVGGPAYIRMLKAPFPDVPLIAAGGVTQHNAGEFILAGATALGIGADLIPHEAIRDHRPEWIRELGRRFTLTVREARERVVHNGAR